MPCYIPCHGHSFQMQSWKHLRSWMSLVWLFLQMVAARIQLTLIHAFHCFSAYAIVADLSTADEHRKHAAEGFLVLGKIPNILQTVLVGRTQGKHCIHRAELSAIVLLFESFENFSVYTDSATSIALINRCRSALSLEELCNHEDFDLLQRIYCILLWVRQSRCIRLRHIRI